MRVKKIISIIFIMLSICLVSLSFYIRNVFGDAKFEQLIFSLQFTEGTNKAIIFDGLKYCLPIVLIVTFILILPFIFNYKKITYLKFKILKLNKIFRFQVFPFKRYILYSVFVLIVCGIYFLNSIGYFEYLKNQKADTLIYDTYYINPNEVEIKFPEKKQNLIYIYAESMESGFASALIDDKNVNLIPNLSALAEENISFSHRDTLGGGFTIMGTTYTIAAMVGQTAGIPLRTALVPNTYVNYTSFLPGAFTLGEILEKEGYRQLLLIGSNAEFAGRNEYFNIHGNYEILDYIWALENEIIPDGYYADWGFEDKKLFELAKDTLLDLAEDDQPFNLTLLTTGTHAIDGYLDGSCNAKYNYNYGNAILCSDSLISSFVNWVEKQDFYENTTIVIVGDHISMQTDVSDYLIEPDDRYIYNAFINSKAIASNVNNRQFTCFDLFPTTLASLGVTIKGDRLGLGVNLFSDQSTIVEELGYDYIESEVQKNSFYYNNHFLGGTYLEILEDLE